jgi:hypothetical protein
MFNNLGFFLKKNHFYLTIFLNRSHHTAMMFFQYQPNAEIFFILL